MRLEFGAAILAVATCVMVSGSAWAAKSTVDDLVNYKPEGCAGFLADGVGETGYVFPTGFGPNVFSLSLKGSFVGLNQPYEGIQNSHLVLLDPVTEKAYALPYGTRNYEVDPAYRYVKVSTAKSGEKLSEADLDKQRQLYNGQVAAYYGFGDFSFDILDVFTGELLLQKITGMTDFNNISDPSPDGYVVATRKRDPNNSEDYQTIIIDIKNESANLLPYRDFSVTPVGFGDGDLHVARYKGERVFFDKRGQLERPPQEVEVIANGKNLGQFPIEYTQLQFSREGLIPFVAGEPPNRRYGFLKSDMTLLTPAKYEGVRAFSNSKAGVKVDGLWTIIYTNGNMMKPAVENAQPASYEMLSSGEMDKFLVVKYPGRDGFYVLDANSLEELYRLDSGDVVSPKPLLPDPYGTQPDYQLVKIQDGMIDVVAEPEAKPQAEEQNALQRFGSLVNSYNPIANYRKEREEEMQRRQKGLFDLSSRKWLIQPMYSSRSSVMNAKTNDGRYLGSRFVMVETIGLDRQLKEVSDQLVINIDTGETVFSYPGKDQEALLIDLLDRRQ